MRMLDPDALSFGYLLPTRDAVTLARPSAEPLLAAGQQAEALGFDAVWVGDSPHARPRHDALLMLAALAARTQRIGAGEAALQATYAGSADGVRQWLQGYVQAGARHIVLRAANHDFQQGLREAARARDLLAVSARR
jgi:Luciferase-like monooxygenase